MRIVWKAPDIDIIRHVAMASPGDGFWIGYSHGVPLVQASTPGRIHAVGWISRAAPRPMWVPVKTVRTPSWRPSHLILQRDLIFCATRTRRWPSSKVTWNPKWEDLLDRLLGQFDPWGARVGVHMPANPGTVETARKLLSVKADQGIKMESAITYARITLAYHEGVLCWWEEEDVPEDAQLGEDALEKLAQTRAERDRSSRT